MRLYAQDILNELKEYKIKELDLLAEKERIIGDISVAVIEEVKHLTVSEGKKYITGLCKENILLQGFEEKILSNFEMYFLNKKITE